MQKNHIIVCIGSDDFEQLSPIGVEDNSANIRLFTTNNEITLEYDDTVILRFRAQLPGFVQNVQNAGEFIRDVAIVNIIDNDRKCS